MKTYILTILSCLFTFAAFAQCTDSGNYWNESWVSCQTSNNPNPVRGNTHWILYEFHENHVIDSSHFWNANRVGESAWGAKDIAVDYSMDGTTWVQLGTYTVPQATEASSYTGVPGPNFGGISINKILITVLSTHDNSGCASIAEVKFQIDPEACAGVVDACGVCDGPGEPIWYADMDGDGLGDINSTTMSCTQPPGYVNNNSDNCDNGGLGWAEIAPLFVNNGCVGCHGSQSGLNLTSYTNLVAGGDICSTSLLTGTNLADIITMGTSSCGNTFQPMNSLASGEFDTNELAMLQMWIDGGAPENCSDFCLTDLTVMQTYSDAAIVHQVGNMITAMNVINGASNVVYDAGVQVTLNNGFKVENPANFSAVIGGCGASSNLQDDSTNNR